MKRIIVSSLAIFPLLPLSGREILWSIMAWQMEPNRGRFIILKPFHLHIMAKLEMAKKYLFADSKSFANWMPPNFYVFFQEIKVVKGNSNVSFFLSYAGRISDKDMACRARPRIMPQCQFFSDCWNIFVYHFWPQHFILLWWVFVGYS